MCPNSQEVGLEAAILERVRNSSLVECARTENVARLKRVAEAGERGPPLARERARRVGRGALSAAEKPDREDRWSADKCECRNE